MSQEIFVLVEHHNGEVTDATHECLGQAEALGGPTVAVLLHSGERALADGLYADRVLSVDDAAFSHFLPEAYAAALAALVRDRDPRLVLIANSTVGIDVGGPLSARTGRPLVAYCKGLAVEGDTILATSQVYGGKLNAEVEIAGPAIVTMVAGATAPAEGSPGSVEDVAAPELGGLQTRFLTRIEPDGSDVDITGEEILVSVGRGIGGEDNIGLAQELADAIGGTVSGSRPVTDAGWLAKTRQVGKSGRKVKPKLYLACGISGAPEHLEGMSDAELIIAINTDEKAPIFDVAHYGSTEDLFDLLPALTEALEGVTA
ncbi:electron transfer flavoprotein subunit alpha/FixB family protein [Conexibacter sp. DBS9H8]|uniref:electron transfer flavoprotein subunit alpha/FixB family protein n=1 Tax=Conexibacter sp. DBS9H8 TaxID=2937801 RepID=UPI00200EFE69|nr:electron transfer flavoprotein subunit alpha/FixB family protein [Conexibacter sp. DBS9H8]